MTRRRSVARSVGASAVRHLARRVAGPAPVRALSRWLVCSVLLVPLAAWPQDGNYRFDLSEIESKPFETSGFVEAKAEHFGLRTDAALFPLNFPGTLPRRTLDRATASFELAAKIKLGSTQGSTTAYARLAGSAAHDPLATANRGAVLEAGVRHSPGEGLSFEVGKQAQRWGKGYAWNPVAFFERPKDPNDPQLAREGFVMASADVVRSAPGSTLAAWSFTPLLLPTTHALNRDFGAAGHLNAGARLYLLLADTDIDLLWAARGSRPQRLGLDFSRNFGSQLELHGEWARTISATQTQLDAAGLPVSRRTNADSWLLGLRAVTDSEVTWIAELYRNGSGVTEDDLTRFHGLLEDAFGPAGTPALRAAARALAAAGFARNNPARHYGYLRVAAKDPFDWLYVAPALTVIGNLDDHSLQLTPEVVYTGWQNLELRARAILLRGREGSEFGEKPAARRLELSLRLYF